MMPLLTRFIYLAIGLILSAIALRAALVGGEHKKARIAIAVFALAPLVYEGLAYAGLFKETVLRFENPPGLVLVAAAGIFTVWRIGKIPARVGKLRRPLVIFFVTLSLLLASLAVAAPEIGKKLDRMTILLGVDRSRSIQLVPNGQERIASELKLVEKGMHDDDRIGTVVFGSEAATEDPVRPKSDLAPPQRIEIGRDGTNIEAAIRHALAEIPADTAGRIILLTDGVQTRGDAMSAAAAAVAADVPVDVVVLEQKNVPDVRVASVRTPAHADEGEALDLRVVTSSAVPADVEVRVKRDGQIISKGNAHIEAGEDVLRVRETATEPGLHRYDVEVTALDPNTDQTPEDNSASSFVRVRGPALALVLEGDPGKGAAITRALESSGFRVDIQSTSGVPSDIGGFAGYDLVVLSDIPASDLATIQIDALASYVKDLGGGLLLLGGDKAFGPGGYARTPIEEISPVGFDLKEEKRRASLAEVIAIDYSGSMGMKVGNQTKLALANEASARSASLLGPGDMLGVEHVDTSVAWTIPLGPVTDVNAIGA
ncbi:MAG: VWA domain-containing protein, partial [Polyangiaceae bacterium]